METIGSKMNSYAWRKRLNIYTPDHRRLYRSVDMAEPGDKRLTRHHLIRL